MKKLIIIDFNRTLYEPTEGKLLPGALEALQSLKKQDYILTLVSKIEPSRENTVTQLGIANLFNSIYFVPSKAPELFLQIMNQYDALALHTYVIGDYLHEEIRSGNRVGTHTIWLKRGAFKDLVPESEFDVPWRTITEMHELEKILLAQ